MTGSLALRLNFCYVLSAYIRRFIRTTALTHAIKAILLKNILLEKKGQGFEDFFSEIAKNTWGENFEIWKPQGRLGDFKCDGYQVQEKTVFQCYGPETPDPSKTAAKISTDFQGAKKHFGNAMTKWVFVYGQRELPAACGKLLNELRGQNQTIEIRCWCHDDLLRFAMALEPDRLNAICGLGLDGHEFDDAIIEALEPLVLERRKPLKEQGIAEAAVSNEPSLEQALDDIGASDREVRRRILGYCMWLDPMSKERASDLILEHKLDVAAIEPNLERLVQMGLVRVTASHILPLNKAICGEAAEIYADEFIAKLEVL